MQVFRFDHILDEVLSCFKLRDVDFSQTDFRCYKIGRIGGLVRIDADEIIIDEHLPTQNETEFGFSR